MAYHVEDRWKTGKNARSDLPFLMLVFNCSLAISADPGHEIFFISFIIIFEKEIITLFQNGYNISEYDAKNSALNVIKSDFDESSNNNSSLIYFCSGNMGQVLKWVCFNTESYILLNFRWFSTRYSVNMYVCTYIF